MDTIFVQRAFVQSCSSICWPIPTLLYYKADFITDLIQKKKNRWARSLNLRFCYIDDELSLNSPSFGDFINRIYPKEVEIKDITDTVKSASYLDLKFEIDGKGKQLTKLYDQHDDLLFRIVNFRITCGNILSTPVYGVFLSQLIRYATASHYRADFLYHAIILIISLLEQGYISTRLTSSQHKFYFRHHELLDPNGVSICTIKLICSTCHSCSFLFCIPPPWYFMSNSAGASRKADDASPTGTLGPFSQFLVEFEFTFFTFCVCLFAIYVFSLSMYCILLISARILVALITLNQLPHLFCVSKWNISNVEIEYNALKWVPL